VSEATPLLQIAATNDEVTRKDAALFHVDRFGPDRALKHSVFTNRHHPVGHNFARHLAANLKIADPQPAKELYLGAALDHGVTRDNATMYFAADIDLYQFIAFQISADASLDQSAAAANVATAQIAFGRDMHFTVGADRAAETGIHLVIAQVNMCAAGRTDG